MVDHDLNSRVSTKGGENSALGVGVIDEPVDARNGHTARGGRAGNRDPAGQQDLGGGSPGGGGLRIGGANGRGIDEFREPHTHLGAERIGGVIRHLHWHGRGARGECGDQQQSGDKALGAAAGGEAGHPIQDNVSDMTMPDTLGGIGESATLARIFPRLPHADAELLGPGDDCAVVSAPDARFVVTTDMMVHGPDFRLAWSSPYDLGWKAAATNLSDVAAMGASPTALVVAIAAPADSPVTLLEGIADGLREACAALAPGCGVVGGDLSVSDTLTLAITAFGDLATRAPVLRSGARAGETLAVSGQLGLAASGLALLFALGVDADGRPDAAKAAQLGVDYPGALAAQLRPSPPISDGVAASLAGATAMLDLSDGLAIDARRVAAASGVRLDFDSSLLGDDPHASLSGGEDHALLATFPVGTALPGGFRMIGRVVAGEGLSVDGEVFDEVLGWDPYRGWNGLVG